MPRIEADELDPLIPEGQPTKSDFLEVPKLSVETEAEAGPEKSAETAEASQAAEGKSKKEVSEPASTPAPARRVIPVSAPQDEVLKKIEVILEEDLAEIYSQLPPEKQQQFKIEGEKAASAIRQLLDQTKIKVSKIFGLIVAWLKIIPGVNKFFLNQEAKIKTDRIVELENKRRNK